MPTSLLQVLLFIPNLIGYARLIMALTAFQVAFESPHHFLLLYTASFVLDAADGWAARRWNQCTMFGTILDMFTDRASTSAAIVVISHSGPKLSPGWVFVASFLVFIDIASHFTRMYMASLLKQSHKDTSTSLFWLLRQYYGNKKVMGAFCVGQEFAYIFYFAYLHYGSRMYYGTLLQWLLYVTVPLCVLKQVVNVQQLLDALAHIAELDVQSRNNEKAE